MCRRLWLILLLCLMSGGLLVRGQTTRATPLPTTYITRNIDNSQGLTSNNVYSIVQDRQGYIWIGTERGLQRYDGLRFMNCFGADTKPTGLVVPVIWPDDARGRLLFEQPDKRLQQWDMLQHVTAPVIWPASRGDEREYRDPDGKRWRMRLIWTDSSKADVRGIALLREAGEERGAAAEKEAVGRTEKHAYCIIDTGRHQTWMQDPDHGLMLLDDRQRTMAPAPFPIDPRIIHGVTADDHGNLWITSWTHWFYRWDRRAQKLYTYSLSDVLKQEGSESNMPVWISSVLEDDHGVVWLATGQAGLLRYDTVRDAFGYLLRQPRNSLALQYTDQINSVFQDKEENIWLGTDKGISIFNPYRQYFSILNNQDAGDPSKVVSDIIPVALVGRDLWVGSWGGGIKVYDSAWRFRKQVFFPGKYDENLVWSFLAQEDGKVWVGCQSGLIHVMDTEGKLLRTMRPPETERRTVKSMVDDGQGNILLGLQSGKVILYNKAGDRFLPYSGNSSYPLSPVENLYMDAHGVCWVSTGKGLAEYDSKKRRFIGLYRPEAGVDVRCWGVCAYPDSLLVVGTENAGLYFFHQRTKTFSRIPVNEEQPHWSAYAIAVDRLGKIWFTTDRAICHYDPVTRKCFVSQPEKGLLNSAFYCRELIPRRDGKWITATSTEIVGFNPEQLRAAEQAGARIRITGFRVFSNALMIDSFLQRQEPVKLGYRQNFISIEFSSLQFSGVERAKYFYRLEGVDPDWVYGGTRGTADYTNLPSGKYTFLVRTESASGDAEMAAMKLEIAAPFWATWWFRALVVAVGAFFIFLLLRWHDKGLRQEASMKQQIAQTEMMALRAQMNPHFIFNCINSIDALIQSDDKYLATVYLNKFARLIRNILDSSKQQTISLARDLETLQLYIDLERFRNEGRFIAEIHVDDGLLEEDCRVPPLIVQPYVENAIVHGLRNRQGGGGRLNIDICREEEYLVYRIEDNGVGRAAAASHSGHHSYGMEMSRDRVNLFNGEEDIPVIITDLQEDGRPAGTRVQVSLKIN